MKVFRTMEVKALFLLLTILNLFYIVIVEGSRRHIENISKKQLDDLLKTQDYLAVTWCKLKNNSHMIISKFG